MIKRIITITLITLLLLPSVVLAASNIDNADWYGIITVSNNSTASTNVATTANISTTNLIAGDFLNATANNTVIRNTSGTDVPFMPGYTPGGYPWCMWVPTISAESYLSYILYTANSTGGDINYFPGAAGMTTADNATMELGDNFTIEQKGWVDTSYSANKTLVNKLGAFKTYISATGNITSAIWGTSVNTTPMGTNDPADAWTDDAKAIDNNLTTYAKTTALVLNGNWSDYLEFTHDGVYLSAVQYYVSGAVPGEINQINIDAYYNETWNDVYEGAVAVDSLEVNNLDDAFFCTRVRISIKVVGGNTTPWIYEVDFLSGAGVTATGISSGEHIVKTTTETNALEFDGADTIVVIPVHASINNLFDAGGTIFAWIRPESDGEGNKGRIVDKNRVQFYVEGEAGGKVKLCAYQAFTITGGEWITTDTEVTLNEWTPIAITYTSDNASTPIFYVNSENISVTVTTPPVGTSLPDNIYEQSIGNRSTLAFTFDGRITEVRFYRRILPPSEIAELSQGHYTDNTSLVAYWRMNEGTGATAFDTSVNSNVGTITNGTWLIGANLMELLIDNVLLGIGGNPGVPDNNNNWTFIENDSMSYLEYQTITINGTLRQQIEWEYDNVFHDFSAYENDATPSFRTANSDLDVTANLTSFRPIAEAQAPDYSLAPGTAFLTAPNITGNFTTVPPTGGFPLAWLITAVAGATTPPQLPLMIIAIFIILAASLSASYALRKFGSGSLIIKSIVIIALMGIFVALKNFGFDFWMVFTFIVIAVAIMFASKQVGWT